jgi:hypothetical protein
LGRPSSLLDWCLLLLLLLLWVKEADFYVVTSSKASSVTN